jgi:hypothetical protein
MTIDTLLAIIGLIVSIILGYLRLRHISKHRNKTEIILLKNASISLFRTIVKNLDDIEINYKGNKINENLILFKATFFNSGNIDIERSIIHKPLEIELPKNYTWISHKLIDLSEGLQVKANISENKLIFEWDLLKEGEYFTFDSLIECKSDQGDQNKTSDVAKKLLRDLKINHRITNLKQVNKENSIPKPLGIGGLIFTSLVFLLIVGTCFYFSFGQFLFPNYQILNEVNIDGKKQFVTLQAEDDIRIVAISNEGQEIMTLTKNELQGKIGNLLAIKKEEINYWTLGVWGLFCILYFIFWISILINEIREKALYRKLKSVADKYDEFDIKSRKQIGFKLWDFKSY